MQRSVVYRPRLVGILGMYVAIALIIACAGLFAYLMCRLTGCGPPRPRSPTGSPAVALILMSLVLASPGLWMMWMRRGLHLRLGPDRLDLELIDPANIGNQFKRITGSVALADIVSIERSIERPRSILPFDGVVQWRLNLRDRQPLYIARSTDHFLLAGPFEIEMDAAMAEVARRCGVQILRSGLKADSH
jgi:hypothetical protein